MQVEASFVGRASAIPEALLFGILLGVLYDVFRVLRTALGLKTVNGSSRLSAWTARRRAERRKRILPAPEDARPQKRGVRCGGAVLFLLDLLFSLLCGVGCAVFFYWRSDGMVRWYLLLSILLGFAAYYRTVGVLVMLAADAVTAALRSCVIRLYNGTLYYVLWLLYRLAVMLLRVIRAGAERIKRRLRHSAEKRAERKAEKRSLRLCAEAEAAAEAFLAEILGQNDKNM